MLLIDDSSKAITIKPGSWTIDRTLVIPGGYRVIATWPLKLNIVGGAEVISYSPLAWKGSEESPIDVASADSSSHGLHVLNAGGTSQLLFVRFSNLTRYKYDQDRSADVSFHRSDATLEGCHFSGTGTTLLDASEGALTLKDCGFTGGSDQLETHFVRLNASDIHFTKMADDAVSVEGESAALNGLDIKGRGTGIGVKGTKAAVITIDGLELQNMKAALVGREGTRITATNSEIRNTDLVAEAEKLEMRYGPVKVELTKVNVLNTSVPADGSGGYKCGKGSSITRDGEDVCKPATVKGT